MDGSDAGQYGVHRPWSTLLLVLHAIGIAVAGLALAAGVLFVAIVAASPPAQPGDAIHEPWGLVVGGFLAVFGLGLLIPAAVLTLLIVRGRRAADLGRPRLLQGVAIAVMAIATLAFAGSLTSGDPSTVAGSFVLAGLYGLPAIPVLRATREGERV